MWIQALDPTKKHSLIMENRKGIEMVFRKRLLSILIVLSAYLMITAERSLAYKSGCSGEYCFILSEYNESTTQEKAQLWCSNKGSQLIEIQNQSIQTALTAFLNTQSVYANVMTNGIRRQMPWTRISGKSIGDDISIMDETDGTYACLKSPSSLFSEIGVYASKPADSKRYICSGSQFNCMNGGVLIDGQCYSSEYLSWYDARSRCLDGGGDLASFDNITTKEGFNALTDRLTDSLLQHNIYLDHWIGFRSERWTWNGTGDEFLYSQWSIGHPWTSTGGDPMNCLCLDRFHGYHWTECTCNDPRRFLCISGATTTTITVTGDGTFPMKNTLTTVTTFARTQTTQKRNSDVTTDVNANNGNEDFKRTTQKNNSYVISGVYADKTEPGANSNMYLGIGLGVGLGLLFIIVIISVIILLFRRRGCPGVVENPNRKLPLSSEVVAPPSSEIGQHYAVVEKQQHEREAAVGGNPTHVEYAELRPSSKKTPASEGVERNESKDSSIWMGNRATLRPPPSEKTEPNHFLINGYEYAEVTKPN